MSTEEEQSPATRKIIDAFADSCDALLYSRRCEKEATEAYVDATGKDKLERSARRPILRAVSTGSSVMGQMITRVAVSKVQEVLPEANREAICQIAGRVLNARRVTRAIANTELSLRCLGPRPAPSIGNGRSSLGMRRARRAVQARPVPLGPSDGGDALQARGGDT